MGILGRDSNAAFYLIFGLCTFFIWCDLSFFGELSEKEIIINGTKYDRKNPTIKLRMQDHVDHYLYLPFCSWLEKTFAISKIPGVTPNAITLFHFCLALSCGRLVACKDLIWRRLAVILYELRSCLDILDGVVFRAQQHLSAYSNGWGTFGYYFDAVADVVGGLCLGVGVAILFTKHLPSKTNESEYKKSHKDLESGKKLLSDSTSGDEQDDSTWVNKVSRRTVYITTFLFALQVITRSGLWDHFLHSYYHLLEAPLPGVPRALQKKVLGYHSTWLSLWLWKTNSGDAFMHFVLLAIFFNKLWGFLRSMIYVGPPIIASIAILCQLHVIQVRSLLDVGM